MRQRATSRRTIPSYGATSVSVPGAVDAWSSLHQRYGKLPCKDLFQQAICACEQGYPVIQNTAFYVATSQRTFNTADWKPIPAMSNCSIIFRICRVTTRWLLGGRPQTSAAR